jgi:uncharacterized protein YeaO (DUF488 family)
MRNGPAGLKALAPSAELLAAFQAQKRALTATGIRPGQAHAEAGRLVRYRERFRREIRSSREARTALREVIAQAKAGDLYLMCMCPWKTPGKACHTYLLLELARELEPGIRHLPEPAPRRAGAGAARGRQDATP